MDQRAEARVKSQRGFSLTELMITVAIMAILATVATPIYTDYIKTSKRSEAKANLESIRLLEEQYFSDQGKYTGTLADLKGFKPGAKTYFTYTIEATNTTFTATATEKESGLGNFTINQDNGRSGPETW